MKQHLATNQKRPRILSGATHNSQNKNALISRTLFYCLFQAYPVI